MSRLAVVASLIVVLIVVIGGCRISLESQQAPGDSSTGRACKVSTTSVPCMDALTHSDLTWIETNIFVPSCVFSGCHNGAQTDPGTTDLRMGMSFSHLVNVMSPIQDRTRKLVVPNDVNSSFLMVMLGDVPPGMATPPSNPIPANPGLMPQNSGGTLLCCQKLDVLERWIMAGALNN